MNQLLRKQLFKMAFATAPVMALMLVTPVFSLLNYHQLNFFIMWGIITTVILVSWMINIAFLINIKRNWTKTWLRMLVVSLIMMTVSYLIFYIAKPDIGVDRYKIELIRVVNILAVNTIIAMLIDLTLTKENKNRISLENAELKILNLEAEYKLLKDQINPHFLFNALSTAKALVRQNPQLAETYLIRLSEFLRSSINNSSKTSTLKAEIDLCRDFISLQQIRFGAALICDFEIKAGTEERLLPFFSILSLIENAIKHNALTIEQPLLIRVESNEDEVIVRNNRQTKFVLGDSSKTGLRNLNERCRLLDGNEIEVTDDEQYFSVKMKLLKK